MRADFSPWAKLYAQARPACRVGRCHRQPGFDLLEDRCEAIHLPLHLRVGRL